MKKYIFFTAFLMTGVLLSTGSMAQRSDDSHKKTEEIVIRNKGDKNIKTTIEINGDSITVNGKPLSEYHGENVSIIKRDFIRDRSHRFFISPENGEDMDLNVPDNDFDKDFNKDFDNPGSRTFLGILTEKATDGVKITSVVTGSAAEKAGLQKEDIITRIDDKKITSPEGLMDIVKSYKPGDNIKIDYL